MAIVRLAGSSEYTLVDRPIYEENRIETNDQKAVESLIKEILAFDDFI